MKKILPHYESFFRFLKDGGFSRGITQAVMAETIKNGPYLNMIDFLHSPFGRIILGMSSKCVDKAHEMGDPLPKDYYTGLRSVIDEGFWAIEFVSSGKKVFKLSESLFYKLALTPCNVPVKDILFPYDTFYLRLPFTIDLAKTIVVDGFYFYRNVSQEFTDNEKKLAIFETEHNTSTIAGLSYLLGAHKEDNDAIGSFRGYKIAWSIIHPLERGGESFEITENNFRFKGPVWKKSIEEISKEYQADTFEKMGIYARKMPLLLRLPFNMALWLSDPDNPRPIIQKHPLNEVLENPKLQGKDRERVEAKAFRKTAVDTFLVGQQVTLDDADKQMYEAYVQGLKTGNMPTHWRRGHWRRVRVGPRKNWQYAWRRIEATLVNKDKGDKPAKVDYSLNSKDTQ